MAALMGVASSISRFASYFLLRRTAACKDTKAGGRDMAETLVTRPF